MTIEEMLKALAMDTGEQLFAIDDSRLGALKASNDRASESGNGVAVIPLQGGLANRGYNSLSAFKARVNAAAANAEIGAIVLDVDSPGGSVAGTPEAAAAVAAAAKTKRVVAVVDTLCASAAYWIASQASEIVLAPSGEVGSIGVLAVHMDMSEMLKAAGITATVMRSVPGKADVSPFEPLSSGALDHMQAQIGALHAQFVRAVAAGRGASIDTVSNTYGQGRTLLADQALRAGMVDKIGSLADAVSSLRTKSGTIRRRSALAFA